jgi:uncharacterized protein (DUF488 family)
MDTQLWTIGHGLIAVDRLLDLLKQAGIEAVADVRTVPYSNRASQFDRPVLETSLNTSGIRYRYFGKELGGRPKDDAFYDLSGHVYYRRMAETPSFLAGMELLIRGADQKRTVVLCSESDPTKCHRNLLVGRVARQRGATVKHILHDGSTRMFDDELVTQTGLPGMEEADVWRSLVQVRQEPQPNTSSSG